jgi:hypothetical protein
MMMNRMMPGTVAISFSFRLISRFGRGIGVA